jgi:hypothetical protein
MEVVRVFQQLQAQLDRLQRSQAFAPLDQLADELSPLRS